MNRNLRIYLVWDLDAGTYKATAYFHGKGWKVTTGPVTVDAESAGAKSAQLLVELMARAPEAPGSPVSHGPIPAGDLEAALAAVGRGLQELTPRTPHTNVWPYQRGVRV